ncbi:MAG: glycogen synthase GlgA [Thiolinea sp.]
MRVLFAASEVFPLIKTGGLADVAYGLPQALQQQGADVRLMLPAYHDVLLKLDEPRVLGSLEIQGAGRAHSVRILEAQHEAFACPLWLVDCPELFERPGNPYLHPDGYDWPDNAERFCVFSRTVARLAGDALGLNWHPDVVHVHDWQTGLVPALLEDLPDPPRSVFTIHNLAYGGQFSHDTYARLQLPWHWWSDEGVEFYSGFSMLKAGIVYAGEVTTVSPTYAQEICTPAFGYGLDGLLRSRSYKLHGILNGVDYAAWNPATDVYLPQHFSVEQIQPGKQQNKRVLLEKMGFSLTDEMLGQPLLGFVGRLVEQKGIDMILDAIPDLIQHSAARFVLIGSGTGYFEHSMRELAQRYPDRVASYIGYSEEMAHLLEAGCDLFLMPSRFEPCGLNQMYSLKYGTLPVVFHTGGLADTVVNATDENIHNGTANGFVFYTPDREALQGTVMWALQHYPDQAHWQRLQESAMRCHFGWERSAAEYLALYGHSS